MNFLKKVEEKPKGKIEDILPEDLPESAGWTNEDKEAFQEFLEKKQAGKAPSEKFEIKKKTIIYTSAVEIEINAQNLEKAKELLTKLVQEDYFINVTAILKVSE